MSCICMKEPEEELKDPIIDVQRAIKDWAWDHFLNTTTRWKLFLIRSRFIIDVPMNYYLFEDGETHFEDMSPDPTLRVQETANPGRNNAASPNTSILSTKYVNDTGKGQVYKFRIERARKASVSISCQKGFSIEGHTKFAIGVADGGVTSKFHVTNTRNQVFEETVLFETSSDINVEERTDCTAMVVFAERETRMRFKLETKMSLASGSAPIYIRRKKDHELVHIVKLNNLRSVFKKYENKKEEDEKKLELVRGQIVDDAGDTYNVYAVKLFTEGIIEGVRLSDQTVKLQATKIEEGSGEAIGSKKEELEKHQEFHSPLENPNQV